MWVAGTHKTALRKDDKPAERLWVRINGHTKMGGNVVDVC